MISVGIGENRFMKRLYYKIKDFLFRDVQRENEAKDTAILLRLLTLLTAVYYLILLVATWSYLPAQIIFFAFVAIGSMIIVFTQLYRDKTAVCLYLYSIISAVSVSVFALYAGIDFGFQYIALFSIFVVFFRTEGALLYKYIYSIIIGIVIALVTLFAGMFDNVRLDHSIVYRFTLMANVIYAMLMAITISRFFCLKFSTSEHKILQYSKKLEQLASIDALTGLQNRRSMMQHLEKLAKNYEHAEIPFSIVIADIDHFKSVNDTYGHDTGDYVLKKLAEIFKDFMAERGHIARWGGEEFLFTFEGNNADYIFVELNNLKTLIKDTKFHFNDYDLNITLTFGLEEFDSGAGLLNVITKADQKLYIGKEQGRNRVIY